MTCVVCQRRPVERPQVCEPCRVWLPGVLRDVADGHAALVAPEPADPTGLLIEDDGSFTGPVAYDVLPLTAGPVRVPLRGAQVSGSREAPVPVVLDVVDLTAPARVPSPARGRGGYPRSLWPEDQIGQLPVATELDLWVIDWIEHRGKGEHRPEPSVPVLAKWLGDRLQDACDDHPAVDEFAADLRRIRSVLRLANGDVPELPTPLVGVPCSRCDQKALYRDPESPWRAECGGCGNLYSDDEYTRWTGLVAGWAKGAA